MAAAFLPMTEDSPPSPISIYGITKWQQEQLANSVAETYGMAVTTLRFFDVYGPGQSLGALASLADGAYDPVAVIASTPLPKDVLDDEIFVHEALGRLWAHGAMIDFARVRASGRYHRVSLPTYAFDRKRHWIEPGRGQVNAAQPETPAISRRAKIDDWFEDRVWTHAPFNAAPGAENAPGCTICSSLGRPVSRLESSRISSSDSAGMAWASSIMMANDRFFMEPIFPSTNGNFCSVVMTILVPSISASDTFSAAVFQTTCTTTAMVGAPPLFGRPLAVPAKAWARSVG